MRRCRVSGAAGGAFPVGQARRVRPQARHRRDPRAHLGQPSAGCAADRAVGPNARRRRRRSRGGFEGGIRRRRPDITITTASGTRIAVEVQYARMSVADYQARSRDHTREYDARAWLLGHVGDNFTNKDGTVRAERAGPGDPGRRRDAAVAQRRDRHGPDGVGRRRRARPAAGGPGCGAGVGGRAPGVVSPRRAARDSHPGNAAPPGCRRAPRSGTQGTRDPKNANRNVSRPNENRRRPRLQPDGRPGRNVWRRNAASGGTVRRRKAWLIAEHNGKIPVLLTATGPGDATISQELGVDHGALEDQCVSAHRAGRGLGGARGRRARSWPGYVPATPGTASSRMRRRCGRRWARFVRELGGKRLVAVRNPRQGRPVAAPLAVARAERERAYQNRPAPRPTPYTSASAASTSTTAFGRARTRARGGADGGRRARAAGRASSGSSGTSAFRSRQRCPHGHPVRAARSHSWSVPHGDASPGLVEPVTPRFRGALPVRLHRPARCAPPSR